MTYGSGWYEAGPSKTNQPAEYAMALVQQATHLYDTAGLDSMVEYYNSPESVDGEWYVLIADPNDTIIVHPVMPEAVGLDIKTGVTSDGYEHGKAMSMAMEDGIWVEFLWPNPATGREDLKRAWAVRHDGMIFASGYYESVPSKTSEPAEYTKNLVQRAIDLHDNAGRDAAIAYYNTPESVDGEWYVFIYDENGVLVSAADQSLVGKEFEEIVAPDGYPVGRSVVSAATEEGVWVNYIFDNPDKGAAELKHAWVVRHDGMIYGSGWYESGPSKTSEPGGYTKSLVQQAIDLHDNAGRDATVAYYNTPESMDSGWYVFITDQDGVLVSHPNEVGTPVEDVKGPNGYPAGLTVAMAATEDGAWVDYIYQNPSKGVIEKKHSWVVRHDGMTYGSGWYEAGPSKTNQPAEYAMALVQQATHLYDTAGLDSMVEYYNSP